MCAHLPHPCRTLPHPATTPQAASRKRTRELADLANTKNLRGTLVGATDLDGEAAARTAGGGGGGGGRELAMSRDELLTTSKIGVRGQVTHNDRGLPCHTDTEWPYTTPGTLEGPVGAAFGPACMHSRRHQRALT